MIIVLLTPLLGIHRFFDLLDYFLGLVDRREETEGSFQVRSVFWRDHGRVDYGAGVEWL